MTSPPPKARSRKHGDVFARFRIAFACVLTAVVCLGYAATRDSINIQWYQSHGGGVPYVAFWILFVGAFLPQRRRCLGISVSVVFAVCGLEFLQLWNPEPLASLRNTRLGAALLGTTFVWHDFPPYLIGGFAGGFILWLLGASDSEGT